MANPQIEDGYCKISNELLDAICKTNISSYESKILWTVIRLTYGYNRKKYSIKLSEFQDRTCIKEKSRICEAAKKLVEKRIIKKNGAIFSINKDFSQWVLRKSVKHEKLRKNVKVLRKSVKHVTEKRKDTRRAKYNIKNNNTKTTDFSFLTDFFNNDPFKQTLDEFRDHRKSLKSKMTPRAEKMLIKKLAELSNNNAKTAIEIMERSILNGWRGVFPLKNQKQKEPEKIKW